MTVPHKHHAILDAYFRLPIEIDRGDGVYVFDTTGKRYLDFASGIAVTSMGHNNDHINQALQNQLNAIWHCSNIFTIPEQERLASRLKEHSFADKVFFCSSGVEAIETSIKLIRKSQYEHGNTDRYRIISLHGGFHGRSIGALSAGGNEAARRGFGPLHEGFDQIERHDIELFKQTITDQTAGVILELVQSEGGVYPLDQEYIKQVRDICDQHGLILCVDEVQTGYGRTGTLFAYQQYGITPDIIALAKGIGNGFPLAACLMNKKVADAITPGSHGSTYGGNPLAMAVGNAVLDSMLEPAFLENSQVVSQYAFEQLNQLAKQYPHIIADVRGLGMLLGLELASNSAKDVMLACYDHGLAVTKCGSDKVIRLLPPLICQQGDIDQACDILRQVFETL